jgi:hypothetical protein
LARRIEVHALRHGVAVGVRYRVLRKYRIGVLGYTRRTVGTRWCLSREVWSLYAQTHRVSIHDYQRPDTRYLIPEGEVQRYPAEVRGEGRYCGTYDFVLTMFRRCVIRQSQADVAHISLWFLLPSARKKREFDLCQTRQSPGQL